MDNVRLNALIFHYSIFVFARVVVAVADGVKSEINCKCSTTRLFFNEIKVS